MSTLRLSHRRLPGVHVCLLTALLLLPGCGGKDGPPVETDTDKLAQVIRELNDFRGNARTFSQAFAKGAAPTEAQRKRYLKHTFAPGKVSVSGDTGKVMVKVLDEAYEKVLSEMEWTLVKEGDQWKLKAAPLP